MGPKELLSLYNQFSKIGRLEACWKIARIMAIVKPGKPATHIDSYRPIALLSCIRKLVEKVVLERFVWDFEN